MFPCCWIIKLKEKLSIAVQNFAQYLTAAEKWESIAQDNLLLPLYFCTIATEKKIIVSWVKYETHLTFRWLAEKPSWPGQLEEKVPDVRQFS